MTKIYVVTTGEYSDYCICAIFSTKENAEQYIKYFENHADYTGYDIKEYTLDPISDTMYRENMKLYIVQMWKDGEVRQVGESDPSCYKEEPVFTSFGNIGKNARQDDPILLNMEVWAKSEEHAIKIVNEKRTRLIYDDIWNK